ncbi:hypothetical protein CKM354_000478100 [Cercospora kikuchii]|uniref:Signal peptide-containing protein n=1 Tax=Cercospora kikuchii TaxID=84275 RepID=A0A9P3FBT9_9PEZI|nr:uncharacterized protein CKM354_000478100 [Cercospora kikuchii]GIZ41478.1 hypothetical protein CKM354_000478100 [Cercospora kikuchii]
MLSKIIPALAIAGAASARIVGLAAPKVIAVNETFTVTLLTENYIQSVKDLVAAFALSPRADADGFIGTEYLGSFYLGPDKSNVLTNITFEVTAPATNVGQYLNGVVTSLYGASNGATTIQWSVPITYGDEVSTEQVHSIEGNNVCSSSTPTDPGSNTTTTAPPSTDPTSPPVTGNCFPTSTQTLIQSSLVYSNALIDSIVQSNNQTGRQNLGQLNGFLGDVSAAVGVGRGGESCNNPPPPAWPPLSPGDSQVRAISILRNVQDALQAEQGAILQCNEAQTKSIQCQVLRLVDNLDNYYS